MNFVLFKIFLIKWVNPALVFVYFCLFHMTQFKYKFIKASMTCLGLEPGVAGADKSTELWLHPRSTNPQTKYFTERVENGQKFLVS